MYSASFRTLLIDARIEDLRRARGTSIHPDRSRGARNPRGTAAWEWATRVGIPRLEVADVSTPPGGPRS
jgi:hypothetical protein